MKRSYLFGKLSGLATLGAAVALTASAVLRLKQAQHDAIAAQPTDDDFEASPSDEDGISKSLTVVILRLSGTLYLHFNSDSELSLHQK